MPPQVATYNTSTYIPDAHGSPLDLLEGIYLRGLWSGDILYIDGNTAWGTAGSSLIGFAEMNYTGVSLTNAKWELSEVPTPASIWLFITALGALGIANQKQFKGESLVTHWAWDSGFLWLTGFILSATRNSRRSP